MPGETNIRLLEKTEEPWVSTSKGQILFADNPMGVVKRLYY